ncbi:MAG: VWA domain-containing protein [Acidobacteriota bacterium]
MTAMWKMRNPPTARRRTLRAIENTNRISRFRDGFRKMSPHSLTKWSLWFASLALSLPSSTGLLAQQDRDKEEPFSLRVPIELVLVPVIVEDPDGNLVHGLLKEDFEIREEGVPQDITYFSADPSPLSVAIVLDQTLEGQSLESIEANLTALVESFSPFDELALFQFENTTTRVHDFTLDKEALLKAFKQVSFTQRPPAPMTNVPGPFSNATTINGIPVETGRGRVQAPKTTNAHITDAIFNSSLELSQRGRNRRKIVVIISNGQNAPGNRHSYDDTMGLLTRHDIIVYGIAQGSSLVFRRFDGLKKFAEPTGGAVFKPVKEGAFAETYRRISQMARNSYVLGYAPSRAPEKVVYRRIQVKIRNPQFKVGEIRAREGYYAVPTL